MHNNNQYSLLLFIYIYIYHKITCRLVVGGWGYKHMYVFFRYVESKHVQVVHYYNVEDNPYCFLRAAVIPSMRTRDEPHSAWVCLEKVSAEVYCAHCTCMAGYVFFLTNIPRQTNTNDISSLTFYLKKISQIYQGKQILMIFVHSHYVNLNEIITGNNH